MIRDILYFLQSRHMLILLILAKIGYVLLCTAFITIMLIYWTFYLLMRLWRLPKENPELLHRNGVNVSDIESNNVGRGFKLVMLSEFLKMNIPAIVLRLSRFHQSKNREARILSNSTQVMDHVLYPENFKELCLKRRTKT